MTVRTRFAPSPTGYLHIGSLWAALFAWLHARHYGGQFILRSEDTDTKRTISDALENSINTLHWFGLDWDEGPDIGGPYGPYIQTERQELYQKWANWLVENDYAYKCFATPEELAQMREAGVPLGYDRRYRDYPADKVAELEAQGKPYVIRLKMPLAGETVVSDLLRGDVVFNNDQFTDYVLLKSNGLPTYHLAVVVDDHFMEISHITRGVEWLNTAPIHVNLYKAFGWEIPVFVHLPVILNPSGKGKLSKRTQAFTDSGEKVLVRADEFMEAGYLPEAVLNFLANVGWTFGDDVEKFSMEEAIERFDLAEVSASPIKLPYSKLDWLNSLYIQEMEPRALAEAIAPFLEKEGYKVDAGQLEILAPSLSIRLKKLTDALPFVRFLYEEMPVPPLEKLYDKKLPLPAAANAFQEARNFLAAVDSFDVDTIGEGLTLIGVRNTSTDKPGPFLGKLRLVVTGQKVSPPVFECIVALGRLPTLQRIDAALLQFKGAG